MFRICSLATILVALAAIGYGKEPGGFRTFKSDDGKEIRAKVVKITGADVQIVRADGRSFKIPVATLSQADRDYLKTWKPAARTGDPDVKPSYYPRSITQIRNGLKAITLRDTADRADGYTPPQREALATVNSYRFLCGIPHELKLKKEFNDKASRQLSTVGGRGEVAIAQGSPNAATAIHEMMSPTGASDLDQEGRRRVLGQRDLVLRPNLDGVGFAKREKGLKSSIPGEILARRQYPLYALDTGKEFGPSDGFYRKMLSGERIYTPEDGFLAYPSPGFYPIEFFQSKGWSVYPDVVFKGDTEFEVRLFKLPEQPKRHLGAHSTPDGATAVKLAFTYTRGPIVFEAEAPPEVGDVYWVSITRRKPRVAISYVVEFFRLGAE